MKQVRRSGFDPHSATNQKLLRMWADGVPTKEIAERLGLTNGGVRTRIYYARKVGLVGLRALPAATTSTYDAEAAWARLYAELVETRRREFLQSRAVDPWKQIECALAAVAS